MLHKLDIGDENVAAFRWEGKLDEKAVKQSMVQFLPELQSRHRFNIYLEITDIDGVEAKALWDDMKYSFNSLSELRNKVDKIALVTDKSWISSLAETSYKFIPGLKLKAFNFSETETAKTFVKE